MTVDSARNAMAWLRARASSTPCEATGHLLEVTTGMPRSSASHMCAKLARHAGWTRRDFDENVSLRGAQPFEGGRPTAHAGVLGDRAPAARGQVENRREVESVRVVDEPVSPIGKTDDRDTGCRSCGRGAPPCRRGPATCPPCQSRPARCGLYRVGAELAHSVKSDRLDPRGSGTLEMAPWTPRVSSHARARSAFARQLLVAYRERLSAGRLPRRVPQGDP